MEDYLGAPFGVYEDRGSKVEAELAGLGEQVLAGLLGDSGPLREAFLGLRARRDHRLEVVIRSNSPKVLGLPWELLKEPTRPVPLVLDGVSVIRSLPGAGEPFEVAGDRLRVLMVIFRPGGGSADVGYQMIARPLLKRLSAVRGQVDWWCYARRRCRPCTTRWRPHSGWGNPSRSSTLMVTASWMAIHKGRVYTDLRRKSPNASPEVVTRTVRVQLQRDTTVDADQLDQSIEITVAETLPGEQSD